MMVPIVLTVLGADRSGIARDVAQVVQTHGGNWGEGRLVRLAGRFAGVVLVEVPTDAADVMIAELRALEGLHVLAERGDAEAEAEGTRMKIEVTATDRPGIVRDVSAAMATASAGIDRFTTDYVEVPMSGGVLFRARILARVAGPTELLRSSLEAIANDLQVEITEL